MDAHNLHALGPTATTSPMGAGKWRPEYAEALRGAHLVILPDKDYVLRAGIHFPLVAGSLRAVAENG